MSAPSQTQASVEAVLFDYGLVLTGPPHPPAWARMQQILGSDEKPFSAAYWRPRHEYDRGALKGVSYWRTVAQELGQTLDAAQVQVLIDADTELWTRPNEDMIRWAAALQAAGVRTGILSNLGDAMEAGVRAHCPWLADFNHLTFSHNLGIAKPEPAIYEHSAQGLGVAPEHILFIDDRDDNIAAARAAGMQVVQYTGHDAFRSAMKTLGFAALLSPATKVEAR